MKNRSKKTAFFLLLLCTACILTSCTNSTAVLETSGGDLSAFHGVGTDATPTSKRSEALGKDVLILFLNGFSGETGLTASVASDPDQSETETLTAHVLLEQPFVSEIKVTLCLKGTDRSGNPLTYSEEQSVSVGRWENLTFSVEPFFSSASLKRGYQFTLLVEKPDTAEDTSTLLYFDGVTLAHETHAPILLFPILISVSCASAGCFAVLKLYFAKRKKEVAG